MTPDSDPYTDLEILVQHTQQAGLVQPARIVLDILRPLDVVCSQCAVFVQPFVRGTSWEPHLAVLSERRAWQYLRMRLDQVAVASDEQ